VERQGGVPGVARRNVVDVPVDSVDKEQIPEMVQAMVADGGYHQVALVTTWDLIRARWNVRYRRCLREALAVPVGTGIVRAARVLRGPAVRRYTPYKFLVHVLSALADRDGSVYVLGGDKASLQTVERNIKATFPGIRVVGRYSGYYPENMERNILTAIRKAHPNLLIVGPGVARGDLWVFVHRKLFNPGMAVWSPEVFEIFADRRPNPARSPLKRGIAGFGGLLHRPWRVVRGPVYLWFGLLIAVHRLRGR